MDTHEYMTEEEFKSCWDEYFGMRARIAALLLDHGLSPGARVLDVPSGQGYFAYEFARLMGEGEVHAVGLAQDLSAFEAFLRSAPSKYESRYLDLIQYHEMDATDLGFPSDHFDFVVNFFGLEDINMTRGKEGVMKALAEFVRVLRPGGVVLLTIIPEDGGPEIRLLREVVDAVGTNQVFHPEEFYIDALERLGVDILVERRFSTGRKMTARQARESLEWVCNSTPQYFRDYGVKAISIDELWERFGERIESEGFAYCQDILVIIGSKDSA